MSGGCGWCGPLEENTMQKVMKNISNEDHPDLSGILNGIRNAVSVSSGTAPEIEVWNHPEREMLSAVSGKSWDELVDFIGRELDTIPMLTLLDERAARYYFPSYLIHHLHAVANCRDCYPVDGISRSLDVPYRTMIGFISDVENMRWIIAERALAVGCLRTLDVIVNNAGFEMEEDERSALMNVRRRLVDLID